MDEIACAKFKGMVFNIQRFSIHDGPGIRTVVFLKGCSLKCRWCSNPESQNPFAELFYNWSKCIDCQQCVKVCPTQCLTYDEQNKIQNDNNKCTRCFECVRVCPTTAMSKKGEMMEVDDVIAEVMKDKDVFEISNGGVTLSGGEVFSQFNFSMKLLKKLKQLNINTAVETSGYTTLENLDKLSLYCDLILYDFKHADQKKHMAGTGGSNIKIRHNLQKLISSHKNVLVRIPVVPGFNSDVESISDLIHALSELNVTEIELLPFHQFGKNKYKSLNREYRLKDVTVNNEAEFDVILQKFRDAGFKLINDAEREEAT